MGFTRCTLGAKKDTSQHAKRTSSEYVQNSWKFVILQEKMIIVHQAAKFNSGRFWKDFLLLLRHWDGINGNTISPVTWLPSRAGRHAGIQGCLSGRWSTKIIASLPFCEANWDQPLKMGLFRGEHGEFCYNLSNILRVLWQLQLDNLTSLSKTHQDSMDKFVMV